MGGVSGAAGTAVASHVTEEYRREHGAVTQDTEDVKEEEEKEGFAIPSRVKVDKLEVCLVKMYLRAYNYINAKILF